MSKTKNKTITILIILVVIIVGIYIALNKYINYSLQPINPSDSKDYTIEIPSGSSTSNIAKILYDNEIIRNKFVFKYYVRKNRQDSKLKAGVYVLRKNMTTDEIIDKLIKGGFSSNTINITIVEGLSLEETAKSISDQTNLDSEVLINLFNNANTFRNDFTFLQENNDITSLEGYLFPETYNIYITSKEEDVVNKMLKQFDDFYNSHIKEGLKNCPLNFKETIILSSIIEKEAMLNEERDEVAAVFLNRLNLGWRLESCATVQYALGEWKERLSFDDLEIDSEYNTYKISGLPPGAICSPSKASILAALNPSDVDYLFFLSKGDGTHYFTNNYDDFLDAKNRYIYNNR